MQVVDKIIAVRSYAVDTPPVGNSEVKLIADHRDQDDLKNLKHLKTTLKVLLSVPIKMINNILVSTVYSFLVTELNCEVIYSLRSETSPESTESIE